MAGLVLDASAALAVLLDSAGAPDVDQVLDEHANGALHAPHLVDAEVLHGLRRAVLDGRVGAAEARQALSDFGALTVERHGHGALLPRAWALRENVSACDALYLALAEPLAVPLLTADRRLARAAREHTALEVLGPV